MYRYIYLTLTSFLCEPIYLLTDAICDFYSETSDSRNFSELESVWKETVVAYFRVLPQNLLEEHKVPRRASVRQTGHGGRHLKLGPPENKVVAIPTRSLCSEEVCIRVNDD